MCITFLSVNEIEYLNQLEMELRNQEFIVSNRALLESAVFAPQASFGGEYLYKDIYEMASVYLYHISQNHGFEDGNKRTAVIAMIAFLNLNQLDFVASEDQLFEIALSVAQGKTQREAVVDFIRNNCRELPFIY